MEDNRLNLLRSKIKTHPNFPKDGINFKDLFSAMRDPEALKILLDLVKEKANQMKGQVNCIVGLEARGFLFGPIMAAEIGVPFIPVS